MLEKDKKIKPRVKPVCQECGKDLDKCKKTRGKGDKGVWWCEPCYFDKKM